MMAQIEERLVELINLASVEVDSNKKVEYLYQIKELALNQQNGLSIENFFSDILAFQNDRNPNVKKSILAFIEAACKTDCKLCPQALMSLNLMLNDSNTEVVKRSIQAATPFYRALVQWIVNYNRVHSPGVDAKPLPQATSGQSPLSPQQVTGAATSACTTTATIQNPIIKTEPHSPTSQSQQQSQQQSSSQQQHSTLKNEVKPSVSDYSGDNSALTLSGEIEKTWLMWLQTINFICNLLDSANNDGIRTHCIKFIETVVLLQTPSDKFTDSSYVLNLIDTMITPIKLTTEAISRGIPGLPKNGILFNEEHKLELVEVAKRRFEQLVIFHGTSHISSVNLMAAMQSLVILAKQRYRLFMGRVIQAMETLHNRLPPTLTGSQIQSVKKFLKVQLTVMLKHPYSIDRFQSQITQLLQAVGSKQVEISKVLNEYKHKYGCDSLTTNNNLNDAQKRIKLESGLRVQPTNISSQTNLGSQPVGKAKHLDLNKLTQELDEKEKRRIVVDSVRRILGEEKNAYIPPAQMEIKMKVLSTLANEFNNTDCPQIIQDYIFGDLTNRHEICYAIIRKNFDVAAKKASKRNIDLMDPQNQGLLKNYFDCFNSYLSRAMDLKDSKEREIILSKLYALRDEYYNLSNHDQEQEQELQIDK